MMKTLAFTLFLSLIQFANAFAQGQTLSKDASVVEIKTFIKQVLDTPLPSDYEIPEYILKATDPEEATKAVNTNYPEFVGKDGEEFLQAIANDPKTYVRLMNECKAVRLHFRDEIRRRNAE